MLHVFTPCTSSSSEFYENANSSYLYFVLQFVFARAGDANGAFATCPKALLLTKTVRIMITKLGWLESGGRVLLVVLLWEQSYYFVSSGEFS